MCSIVALKAIGRFVVAVITLSNSGLHSNRKLNSLLKILSKLYCKKKQMYIVLIILERKYGHSNI